MTIALVAAVYLLTIVVMFWLLENQGERHAEDMKLVIDTMNRQLDAEREERRQLNDRLQRPEMLPAPKAEPFVPVIPEPDLPVAGVVMDGTGEDSE